MEPLNLTLTSQSRSVLEKLLQAPGPVSTGAVARSCGLTQAQVRFALRTVSRWLGERGAGLVKTPRVGLQVDANPTLRRSLLEEARSLGPSQVVMSADQRRNLLLLRLLTSPSPTPESQLQVDLGVSRSCFFRDLDQARSWLDDRGLTVVGKRRLGLRLTGEEGAWRDALVELLGGELGQGQLISLCLRRPADQNQPGQGSLFEAAVHGLARQLDLAWAEERLSQVERHLGGVFPDRARAGLVLHLALAMNRPLSGFPIGGEETAEAGRPPTAAGEALGQAVGSSLAPSEVAHLAALLADALAEGLLRSGDRRAAAAETRAGAPADRELAMVLTREAAKYLNARLFRDEELTECLALELATAHPADREAVRSGVEARSTALFGFVQRVLGPLLLAHDKSMTPSLAAALAAHIETALERQGRLAARRRVWVVCGAGVATARNLVTRLNLYLPQLEILGLASAFELAREPGLLAGADAVISTIPLDWLDAVPVLRVSPLLTGEDVGLLRTTLSLEEGPARTEVPVRGAELLGLADLLSADSVALDVVASGPAEGQSRGSWGPAEAGRPPTGACPTVGDGYVAARWEAVVERAGALLLAAGAVWPSYVEAMKDMIRLYGPYVVVAPGAALLHAGPDMGSKRLRFGLVVLRQPVAFGHETNDPVSVALAFSAIDHATHVRAVGQAISLLANGDALSEIRTAGTVEAALAAVRKWS